MQPGRTDTLNQTRYVLSGVAARATRRGLQSVGVLASERAFGILQSRLCGAHVPDESRCGSEGDVSRATAAPLGASFGGASLKWEIRVFGASRRQSILKNEAKSLGI
jgi:hypothetical protein